MIILISETQKDVLKENIVGQKVMVYYNLHKHTFSVQKSGVVVLHADYVKLSNVEFRVRKGGLSKVRKEKVKNVHAFVIGVLEDFCEFPCSDIPQDSDGQVISYNPYTNDSFVIKSTQEPIFYGNEVNMINGRNKIYLLN
jgi:tRNA-binding EMAP/Myf-like protein